MSKACRKSAARRAAAYLEQTGRSWLTPAQTRRTRRKSKTRAR